MGKTISTLVFQPPEITYQHAKKHIIWITTKSAANIPAFFIDRHAPVTILFSHGNAEDLGMIYEWFYEFSKEIHVNLLAYDYEGYGKATGAPSEVSCYEDIEAVFSYLTETLNKKPENIILYGRSLGSGPCEYYSSFFSLCAHYDRVDVCAACYLAEKLTQNNVRIGGLMLQSPLLSVFRVVFNFRFTFPGDMFPNIDRVANIKCPVFIIHGTRDEIVPFWNGEQLFFAVPSEWRAKPYWVEDGGHNNIESLLR
jgi:fermentation-respiration switch protein FrsA (DUF1100 family)